MPGPVGFVGAAGALFTALVGPFANDVGPLQHNEFIPNNARLGVNVSLRDSECEDGGVDARGRGLPIRECLGAAQDVDAEDREDTADLVEECLGVGLLSFRELAGLWSLSIVRQGTAFGCSGDFDKSGFKVAPVPFIEGVVTAADEDCPVPPVLFAVVLTESCGEVFSSPDVAGDVLDGIGVIAKT